MRTLLELIRPANVVTAFADVLTGLFIAGALTVVAAPFSGAELGVWPFEPAPGVGVDAIAALLAATFGLYAGGIVLNDYFDRHTDATERPERPIPSGRIAAGAAAALGGGLLAAGVVAGFIAGTLPGLIATGVALCALLYDARAKHSVLWGPVFMGLCRSGNLLMGVAIVPASLSALWFTGLFALLYIPAITLISRGEVHGGSPLHGWLALAMVGLTASAPLLLPTFSGYTLLPALPFLLLFAAMVLPPFTRAAITSRPEHIRRAVRSGVVSLVLLNALLAAGFGGWPAGLLVALLFPLSAGLGRLFAVT